jgi:hypothetical protein
MTESIQFRLQIACDNAAFEDDNMTTELARILRDVARRLEAGEDCGSFVNVRDINGNVVGSFALKSESAMRNGRIDRKRP